MSYSDFVSNAELEVSFFRANAYGQIKKGGPKMAKFGEISAIVLASGIGTLIVAPASAENFNIPGGTLSAALDEYAAQTGMPIAATTKSLTGVRTRGVSGEMSPDEALTQLLSGTGFAVHHVGSTLAIVRASAAHSENVQQPVEDIQL